MQLYALQERIVAEILKSGVARHRKIGTVDLQYQAGCGNGFGIPTPTLRLRL